MAQFDNAALQEWARDLKNAPAAASRDVYRTMKRAAQNMKDDWRDEFVGHARFEQIGPTINYDVIQDASGVTIEVGPDRRRRSARLANIAIYGSSRAGGGTVAGPTTVARREMPGLAGYLAEAAEKALR